MTDSKVLPNDHSFLAGGGEMGALIRTKDWSKTSIGNPANWPQSLRTTLSIILNSKFPMFLFWGPESICFYNDAYRPSLGNDGKHPDILGGKGAEHWEEIWAIIKPLIDQVLAGGEASWSEDQLIPIYRNGKIEDVYWTFSYSPVNDESGKPAGVFVTCNETTGKIIAGKELEESKEQLQFAIESAELATWDYNPMTNKFTSNNRLKEWFGLEHGTEIELQHAINCIIERDRDRVSKEIQKALQYSSGGNYDIVYTIVNPVTTEEKIVMAKGRAWFNDDKTAYRFNGILQDVTEQTVLHKNTEKSEEQLRIALEGGELGTFDFYPLTGKLIWSAKAKEFFGLYPGDEINLDIYMQAIHPDDRNNSKAILQQDIDIKKSGLYELEYRTNGVRDGKLRWVRSKGKATYDDAGIPIRYTGILQDITERKNAEHELKEREERFRLLADSMPQFVWSGDAAGNLNYFNTSVYKYSGLTPEIVAQDGWLQIVHPDEREENIKQWIHSISTGKDFNFEHRFRRYDGEYRWQLSRSIPLKDESGNIQMWVGTSTDIHEIKELDQQKDLFIGIASHELKTPITTIKGYIQVLVSIYGKKEDLFLKNSLQTVDKQIIKLTSLISDMLDLSKLKLDSLFLNTESFEMNELVEEIIDEINHINSDYKVSFSKGPEATIFADRERIGQVLTNFLTNAIKYSPENKLIETESYIKDGNIHVLVKDSGIGISKKNQERIFERFYRVEGKNEKTFPGFGIGLFIASEIIQKHKGQIGVTSNPGEGSVFYFSLPLTT